SSGCGHSRRRGRKPSAWDCRRTFARLPSQSLCGADLLVCAGRPRPARPKAGLEAGRRPGGLPYIVGISSSGSSATAMLLRRLLLRSLPQNSGSYTTTWLNAYAHRAIRRCWHASLTTEEVQEMRRHLITALTGFGLLFTGLTASAQYRPREYYGYQNQY